ncbi:MAG: envelope stress response membrane protein PspC [Pseudomonadota bacterium]
MKRTRKNLKRMKRHMRRASRDFQNDVHEEFGTWNKAKRKAGHPSRSSFYLDKRNGRFLGVCAGIADYTGISTLWVRVAFLVAVLFGMPFVIIGYFIVGFIADTKPRAFEDSEPQEQEFWRNVRTRPHTTVREVRLRFKDMERRLQSMERYVTSNGRRLSQEINALRD